MACDTLDSGARCRVIETLTNLRLAANTSQRVIALGVVVATFYFAQPVVITFICSLLFAFLLEPLVAGLVRIRLPRALAALIVCLLALTAIGLLGALLYSRAAAFAEELPRYESTIRGMIENVTTRVQRLESLFTRFAPPERQPKNVQIIEVRPRTRSAPPQTLVQEVRVKDETSIITTYVLPQVKALSQVLLFASFVPFLVYFMLSWRDHVRHGFVNLFEMENRQVVHNTLNGVGAMVRAFLVGNFLLGILLVALSSLIFWYMRIPFAFIMGTLSGLLSLIPYVGLPLAIIPPVFSALGVYRSLSSYLIIISIVTSLYLLAQNVLYPKLVGARVHLNPLAVTVAILVWTWMWGAIGLLLAIPITAAIKAICDNVPPLRRYGELLGD